MCIKLYGYPDLKPKGNNDNNNQQAKKKKKVNSQMNKS